MARSASAESLARKLARQNTAELAALADATGAEHIAAFVDTARAYASRVLPVWDLPHHRFRDTVVTVGGMVGAACAEWHLHAWDLAASLGKDYQPASPELLAAGWRAGMPHLPLHARVHVAPCGAAVAGAASHEGAWQALLRASGRLPGPPGAAVPARLPPERGIKGGFMVKPSPRRGWRSDPDSGTLASPARGVRPGRTVGGSP